MRILIFNWRDFKNPYAGGAEIVTHEHAKAWVRAGHEVTVFTSLTIGAKRREQVDGVDFIRYGNQVIGVHIAAIFWYLFGKDKHYDLIIDQIHGIPFFTPLFVRRKKIAFIHETTKEVWRLNPWPIPFNYIAYLIGYYSEKWIFKILYRNIDFLTVSESTKSDLIEWGIPEQNITIIHNGVTIIPFSKERKKEKKKTAMYLGALAEDKGIYDVLKAFAIINDSESDWQFWFVGKGNKVTMKRLKTMSSELGLDNTLKFWGFVSEKEKFELLSRAHVLVNASVREGWGLVIIEAASQKTPAVVYNVPGLRDSVVNNKTGIILTKNTPDEIANAVISLAESKKRYIAFQKNCQIWAKSFSWTEATQKSLAYIGAMQRNT